MTLLGLLPRGRTQFVRGLAIGVTVGITITVLVTFNVHLMRSTMLTNSGTHDARVLLQQQGDAALAAMDHEQFHKMLEGVHGDGLGESAVAKAVKFEDLHAHHDDDTLAKMLYDKVRVLVWVMTGPQNLDKKAVHVRNTWGQRINKLLFMSSQWNSSFPTVGLNVSEGREHLTGKTMQAFRYVYSHHLNDADWFMKADDDTYVVAENLRYMLSVYDPNDPIYFGHAFKAIVKQGYASGGAGYVISKEALRRLVLKGNNESLCRQDGGAEDAEIGKCFMRLGVKLQPSTDRLGRSRFHCFGPEAHLQGGYPSWFYHYDALGARKGMDNISDYPVTFHYIGPAKMYALEYFIYHMRPYGIISRTQALNVGEKTEQH